MSVSVLQREQDSIARRIVLRPESKNKHLGTSKLHQPSAQGGFTQMINATEAGRTDEPSFTLVHLHVLSTWSARY